MTERLAAMPKWSPPDGPWCLRQWIPLPDRVWGEEQKVDTCLLALDHDGDCRGIQGMYHSFDRSIPVGQLQMKEDA